MTHIISSALIAVYASKEWPPTGIVFGHLVLCFAPIKTDYVQLTIHVPWVERHVPYVASEFIPQLTPNFQRAYDHPDSFLRISSVAGSLHVEQIPRQ